MSEKYQIKSLIRRIISNELRGNRVICEQYREIYQKNPDYYKYIPMTNDFMLTEMISDIYERITQTPDSSEKIRFVDAGCGYPLIPHIVNLICGIKSEGIEINKTLVEYFKISQSMPTSLSADKINRSVELKEGNILTHDFREYDYIYSYSPIFNSDLMFDAVLNIRSTMKNGAVLYFTGVNSGILDTLKWDLYGGLSGPYFKFVKNDK